MTVASGRRPDAGTLVPQQQGDGLELRAHGRRHAAALGRRLDLTGVSGEHRHDIAVVADASLIPRGGARAAAIASLDLEPVRPFSRSCESALFRPRQNAAGMIHNAMERGSVVHG